MLNVTVDDSMVFVWYGMGIDLVRYVRVPGPADPVQLVETASERNVDVRVDNYALPWLMQIVGG